MAEKWWTEWRCITDGCYQSGSGEDMKKVTNQAERHTKNGHSTLTSTGFVRPGYWGPNRGFLGADRGA